MTAFSTRIFPPEASEAGLRRQWTLGTEPDAPRAVLLRMPGEDPLASDHLGRLFAVTPKGVDGIGRVWAAAQLAADAM